MRYYIHIIVFFILSGCVEPYDYETDDFEKFMVIEGTLSNESTAHEIRLSYTRPIDNDLRSPVTGAGVYVEDGSGTVTSFTEGQHGSYWSPDNFQAVAGRTYRLFVTTANGRAYRSKAERLTQAPPIDSIYARYETIPVEGLEENSTGMQFFIDAHDDSGNAEYFRYEWEDTYQIKVPSPSQYIYNEADTSWTIRTEKVGTCYSSDFSKELLIATSALNVRNRVAELPVRHVSLLTDMLRNRYSIKVKQYAISEEAYNFYRKIKEINESGGTLSDKQQGAVIGNLESVNDPDEVVLGYFEVAGVSELREFFDPENFDPPYERPPFRFSCKSDQVMEIPMAEMPLYLTGTAYRLIAVTELPTPVAVIGTKGCTDCTWYSTNVKPHFWID